MLFPDEPPRDVWMPLALELGAAFREQRIPFFPAGNLDGWSRALQEVMIQNDLECAKYAARHISAVFPDSEYSRNLCAVFDLMPPADAHLLPLGNKIGRDIHVVHRPGADTVILLFAGAPHLFGLPLCVVHRWFGRLPVSLIYLADLEFTLYLDGIRSLAPNREATLTALRDFIASLGCRRILCFGDSAGGFSALHYGLDLAAAAVLVFGATTNIRPEFNAKLRQKRSVGPLYEKLPGRSIDLRALFAAASRPPRTMLVYAEQNWDDRLHAFHLSSLSNVTLRKVANYPKHNVTVELIRRGDYQSLLDWLVGS